MFNAWHLQYLFYHKQQMHILKFVTNTGVVLFKARILPCQPMSHFAFWCTAILLSIARFFLSAYECVVKICGRQGSQPSDETPLDMGATLDIQRQQRMDLLDQQLLLAQYNEAQRNPRHQPQVGGHRRIIIAPLMNKLHKHTRCQNFIHFSCSNYTSSTYVQSTGFCLIVCVVWVVTVDQVVPLPETQRTEPTPNAAPPPGSDTPIHTAPTTGQLSGCRGAGGCSPCVPSFCVFCNVFFFITVLVYFPISRYSITY